MGPELSLFSDSFTCYRDGSIDSLSTSPFYKIDSLKKYDCFFFVHKTLAHYSLFYCVIHVDREHISQSDWGICDYLIPHYAMTMPI